MRLNRLPSPTGVPPAVRSVLAAIACAITALLLLAPGPAHAALTVAKDAPPTVLLGNESSVTLRATNDASGPYGYNLSFRDVLPAGVRYVAGSARFGGAEVDPTVIQNAPSAGQTTLIFSNVADISLNSTQSMTYRVAHTATGAGAFAIGQSYVNQAAAYANSNPRVVPAFTATGAPVASGTGMTSNTGQASTQISAIQITKSEPSSEGEIMRGVHRHQTVYTVRVTNNGIHPTTGIEVDDYLPAGLEFLGCGTVDNTTSAATNLGSALEYPGSGAINAPGNRPSALNASACRTPARVETVRIDPDGSGPLPEAVYTHVRWTGLGTLQPGQTVELQYVAAIPLRENTLDWSTSTATTGGTAPSATAGTQTANLNNNSGPETRDEQRLDNHAIARGVYRGNDPNPGLRINVEDRTTLTRTAEDLAVAKSVNPGQIAQNGISTWTLRFRTSEYRRVTGAVATDTLPNGLCPLGASNYERTPPTANAECNPVSGQTPSLNYASVDENANGSWTITWNLPDLGASADYTMSFPTRTRRFYQQNFANDAANPVRAGDSWTNTVDVTGDDHRICVSGNPNCTGGSPVRIAGDGPDSRTVVDASSASQTSGGVSIDKTVLNPTGVPTPISCSAAQTANPDAYVDAPVVPTYGTGDRICWRLRVDFSSTVDTGEPVIRDYIPAGLVYEAGSAQPTSRNTLAGLSVDDSAAAADRILTWQLADVNTANQVFEWVFSTTVAPNAVPVNEEQTVTGNLMKLAYRNTGGQTFSLRDRVEAEIVKPIVGLVKDVTSVSPPGTATISGGNATNVGVGATVNYRVRLSNTGDSPAVRTVVWDNLPAGVTCANVVPMSISNGGTCAPIPLSSNSRITWSPGVSVPAGGTTDLTYQVVVPQGQRPAATLTNTAGVVEYARNTNSGGSETFVPANNIDPTRTTTNAPRADDPASITLRDLALAKSVVTTSVTESGNNAASQATIGETIDYRVRLTVPAGTTLFGTPTLTDVVNARMELLSTPAPAISQSGGSAVTTAPTVTANGNTLTATFAGPYVNSGTTDAVFDLTFRARVRDLTTPSNANRRGQTLPNSATLAWRQNSGDTTNTTRTSNTQNVTIVEPNLGISKVAALMSNLSLQTSTVSAGDGVRYTVMPRNPTTGNNVAPSHETVTVDTVPVGITPRKTDGTPVTATGDQVGVTGFPIGTWNATARTITWSHGTLTPGADPNLIYEADVDSPAPAGLVLTNSATVTGSSLSGSDPNERTATSGFNTGYTATATRPLTVRGGTLTKTAVSPRATVGDLIDYTVEYTLPPNVAFFDLLFNDYLPDGVEYVPGSVQSTCLPACTFAGTAAAPNAIAMPGRSIVSGQAQHGFFLDDIPAAPTARTVRLTYQGRITKDYFVAASGSVDAGDVLTNNVDVLYNATNKQTAPLTGFPNLLNYDQRTAQVPASVIVTEPRITLDKHVSGIPVGNDIDRRDTVPGDDYTYTLTVTNTGTSPAYDVDVTDTPSDKLTNVVATAAGVSPTGSATVVDGDGDDGSLAWTIPGPLAPGASVTLTYTADLVNSSELSANETVVNTATVPSYWNASEAERTADPDDGFREYTTNPPTDTVTLDVRLPNVTVQKTTGVSNGSGGFLESAPAEIGESFPWRVVITNPSPSSFAHNVEVADILPAGWSYDEGSAAFAPAPSVPGFDPEPTVTTAAGRDTLSWTNIGTVSSGGQVVLTFTATPDLASKPSPNPQQNTVAAAGRDSDGEAGSADGPYADDDTADANLQLPTLTVAKTPDGANATAGATTNYSVVISNTSSTAPARDVVVTDVLGVNQSYSAGAATASPATGFTEVAPVVDDDAGTTAIGWRIASIPPSGSVTITVPVLLDDDLAAGTTLRNDVSVVSREITEPVEDDGTLTSTVDSDVGVVKSITAPTGTLVPGETVTYEIVATNHGPSVATGVEVEDELPVGLTLGTAPGCAIDRRTLNCAVGTLAVGASETFTVTANIDPSATGSILNTATVSSTTPDSNSDNDSSPVTRGLTPAADLEVTKTVSDDSVHQGDTFTYEIKVRNDGPSDAVDVTLNDPLPAPGVVLATTAPTTDKGTCTPTSATNTVNCSLGTLAPDETATITITAQAVNVGTFNNAATAATPTDEVDTDNNVGDVDVTVEPVADVGIEKTAPATVAANSNLTYTLRLSNAGPSPATNVVVTDVLPDGVDFVSASPECQHTNGTVTCELANLPVSNDPDDDPELTITVHVPWDSADATLSNTASVVADELDRNDDNDSSTANTTVDPVADLEVTKTASHATRHQGDTFTYEITVRNDGPSDAADVILTDALPAPDVVLSDTVPTTDKGTCTPTAATNTVNCELGTLAPDETATITITARAVNVGTFTNVATAATPTNEPDTDNNADDADVTVEPVADVGIEKTAPATVAADDNLTYTLRLSNAGPSPATNVVVTDVLPDGVDFVSASPECQHTNGTITCELATLPVSGDPDDDPELTITVHVPWDSADATLSNTASVVADELDRNDDNDDSTANTGVGSAANLKTTKSAPTLPVPQTVPFEYRVTVLNVGPSTAVNAKLSDPMPAGVTALEADSDLGSCAVTATQVDCELGDLAVDQTATVTITARGDLPGQPTNTATASSDTPEVDPTDNAADADVTILAASDVGVVKSAPRNVAANGDLTYTLTTTNHGPSDATGVTVSDPLPAGVEFRSAADGCTLTGRTVTCAVGELAEGDAVEHQIVVFVPFALGGQTVTNIASVTVDQVDLNPDNDSSQAETIIGDVADLVVTKAAAGAVAGGQASWTVTVRNDGPSAAQQVLLRDQLPEGTTYRAADPSAGTCFGNGREINCELGTLAAGGSAQVTIVADVAADATGRTLRNVVGVQSSTPDPDTGNNTASADVVVAPAPPTSPNLRVTKTASTSRPVLGRPLNYRITVTNDGGVTANDVRMTDTMNRAARITRATPQQGSCAISGSSANCELGAIAPGQTVTVDVRVTPQAPGDLRNTVSVQAVGQTEQQLVDNTAVAGVRVTTRRSAATLRKSASKRQVRGGQRVTYTITAKMGRQAGSNVRICDRLPRGMTFVRATGARFSRGQACWTVRYFAANRTMKFRIVARSERSDETRTIRNRAVLRGTNVSRRTASATVRVTPALAARAGGVTG